PPSSSGFTPSATHCTSPRRRIERPSRRRRAPDGHVERVHGKDSLGSTPCTCRSTLRSRPCCRPPPIVYPPVVAGSSSRSGTASEPSCSTQAPASYVAWDLLALGDEDLREAPLAERRERLEHVMARASAPVHLSPATRDHSLAEDWFRRFEGAGLDGVMAKRLDEPYRAG